MVLRPPSIGKKAETYGAGRAEKLERDDMDTAVFLASRHRLHNMATDSTRSTQMKKMGDLKFLDERTQRF
jgi:hypothetical protein